MCMRQKLSAATSTSAMCCGRCAPCPHPSSPTCPGSSHRTVTTFWAPQEIIDGIETEVELAQVLGLGAANREFEDHVAR